jgi:hypothetical protein
MLNFALLPGKGSCDETGKKLTIEQGNVATVKMHRTSLKLSLYSKLQNLGISAFLPFHSSQNSYASFNLNFYLFILHYHLALARLTEFLFSALIEPVFSPFYLLARYR